MAIIHYDDGANVALIQDKKVAIIGYGSQGHAHALNLRDSGVDVRVALRADSLSKPKAEAENLQVTTVAAASDWADVVMMLAPDTSQAQIYQHEVEPYLGPGKMLMFSHGFNIRFETIAPPSTVDVTMVAPKAPGHRVRETYVAGQGTPALLAIHQDASGKAHPLTLSYAKALGATRAGVIETTFAEETETDLFGEQVVLCGGLSALIKASFEILVKEGYQPEVAYFECVHELKLIVDLIYKGGLNYMRYSISDTAEHGDYSAGSRLINEDTVGEMQQILAEIKDGSYAKKWIAENEAGRPWFNEQRRNGQEHLMEKVGSELREMMPFLDAVTIKPGE